VRGVIGRTPLTNSRPLFVTHIKRQQKCSCGVVFSLGKPNESAKPNKPPVLVCRDMRYANNCYIDRFCHASRQPLRTTGELEGADSFGLLAQYSGRSQEQALTLVGLVLSEDHETLVNLVNVSWVVRYPIPGPIIATTCRHEVTLCRRNINMRSVGMTAFVRSSSQP
jgi:hypothetical protein